MKTQVRPLGAQRKEQLVGLEGTRDGCLMEMTLNERHKHDHNGSFPDD